MPDHHGVDVDDRAADLPGRREGLGESQRPEHAEFDGIPDVLKRGVGQRFHRRHPERVVDQHVDLAVGRQCGFDEVVHLSSSVMSVRTATAAMPGVVELLGQVVEALDGARRQHQVGTRLGASVRQRGTERRARRH